MKTKLKQYLSLSGSFSRIELLVATVLLGFVAIFLVFLRGIFPDAISYTAYKVMLYSLYPVWGAALGKRSRDLGTTFTYGMIIGMTFPVIGLVFLFQAGKKANETKTAEQRGGADAEEAV